MKKNKHRWTDHKTENKKGWSYTATVRVKGHPSVSRTFDTKGEAAVWAAGTEEII